MAAKSRYEAYSEEGNRFLRDTSIIRKEAPAVSDQSDNLVFEWVDVDLSHFLSSVTTRYDGLMMKRVDETHVAIDADSVWSACAL